MTDSRARYPLAVHVFLVRGDEVLLLRRANTGWEDGKWSVPAGHVEQDETASEAALRETLEEVGVPLARERLAFAGVMHRQSEETRVDLFFRYALEPSDPAPRNCEPAKCSELRFAPLRSLPGDTIPYVRAALANLAAGVSFDEHGWPLQSSPQEEQRMSVAKQHLGPDGLFSTKGLGFTHVVTSAPGTTVYISGQTAFSTDRKIVGGSDLGLQAQAALENLRIALAAAKATPRDVVATRVYIVNFKPEQTAVLSPLFEKFYAGGPPPASTWVGVTSLAVPGFLIEIEATAVT